MLVRGGWGLVRVHEHEYLRVDCWLDGAKNYEKEPTNVFTEPLPLAQASKLS